MGVPAFAAAGRRAARAGESGLAARLRGVLQGAPESFPKAPARLGRGAGPDLSPPAAGRTFRSFEIHSRCPIRPPRLPA
ncbi:hypothetical protein BVI434_80023 [Burkholderia vietnamiensis]|nr:hypothetical protein BVI434_80023 [Burkholderia vietnamiensis]